MSYEIILVDDGSTDGTREWLAGLGEPFRVVLNERNLGFGARPTAGPRSPGASILALLNNDLVLDARLAGADAERPRASGPAGRPRRKHPAERGHPRDRPRRNRRQTRRASPSTIRPGAGPRLARCLQPAPSVFAVTGACVLVRADTWRCLGGFDEAYVNGCEDVDLCLRAREAGPRERRRAAQPRPAPRELVARPQPAATRRTRAASSCAGATNSPGAASRPSGPGIISGACSRIRATFRTGPRPCSPRSTSCVSGASPPGPPRSFAKYGHRRGARPLAGNVFRLMMSTFQHTPPFGGAFARRFTRYSGLFFDEFAADSAWIRETAVMRLPPMADVGTVVLKGEFLAHPGVRGPERGFPTRWRCSLTGTSAAKVFAQGPGPGRRGSRSTGRRPRRGSVLYLALHGTRLHERPRVARAASPASGPSSATGRRTATASSGCCRSSPTTTGGSTISRSGRAPTRPRSPAPTPARA